MAVTPEQIWKFQSDVRAYVSKMEERCEANREALKFMLSSPRMNEQIMKDVLWKMKRWDDADNMEIEAWMQKFFS